MFRRTACGTLLCVLAALAGGCGDTTIAPTETPKPITETFDGHAQPGRHDGPLGSGGADRGGHHGHLKVVGPDATKTIGFSLGTLNPTTNVCTVVFDNPAALPGAVFNATASTAGFYCARVYDNGSVAAAVADGSATSFSYTVTVAHPQ